MARPRKEIDQDNFEKLCALQCTEGEIAFFFDVSVDTIERWCKRTYNEGFADIFSKKRNGGKIRLRRAQFQLAEKNASMAIWLGKQYLDQCEPMEVRRLELELRKLESRLNCDEEESDVDNSMLDALNSAAVEVWGGCDDGGAADGCQEKEDSS